MRIHDVNQGIQGSKSRKRIGRGPGSGQGKTAGRGHKGQKSRAGWSRSPVFQGGAMPMVRRVPKRGFNNKFAKLVAAVNVGALEEKFENGGEVTVALLKKASLIPGIFDEVKILGDGELTKKLKVSAHRFSRSARQKIEEAGGEVIVVEGRVPLKLKQARAARSEA